MGYDVSPTSSDTELEMEMLLGILTIAFLVVLFGMNTVNMFKRSEGFQDKNPNQNQQTSPLAPQIKAVLDPMTLHAKDLCSVFSTVRKNMVKNEKAGQSISDQEAERRVDSALALKIPGGALPCPILTYPKETATDVEWLTWLSTIPPDFGARIVLMAVYANDTLQSAAQGLRSALSGNLNAATKVTEAFAVCPPDVAATRRAEKAKQGQTTEQCILPEDAKPEDIQEQATLLLKRLVSTKEQVLKTNNVDPTMSIQPLLQQAKTNQAYLEKQGQAAEQGTLEVNLPPRP
jgi:hypothetical protein